MASEDQLFRLIQSMTRSEKRHFKLFARAYQAKSSNHQITLFDAYARLKNYNSKSLAHAVRKEKFAPYLSALKHQLFKLVLDSLADQTGDDSPSAALHRQIAHINILHSRGVFQQCKKVITRTRAKAELYEQHNILLDLLTWERRIQHDAPDEDSDAIIQESFADTQAVLADIQECAAYEQLISAAQTLRRRHARTRERARQAELQQQLEHPLLNEEYKPRASRNQLQRFETRASLLLMLGEYERARTDLHNALGVWAENTAMQQLFTAEFKKALDQFLNCCIACRNFEHFAESIKTLKDLNSREADGLAYHIGSINFLELTHALNCGLIQEGLNISNQIRAQLPELDGKIRSSRVLTLLHNCAITYFVSGDFGAAAEVLSEILTHNQPEVKRDILEFAHLLQLIVHFELGNIALLQSLFRTTSQRLKKRASFQEFEQRIIATLRKLLDSRNTAEVKQAVTNLHTHCINLATSGDRQSAPVGLSEVLLWLNSKLSHHTILKVYDGCVKKGEGVFSAEALLDTSAD